MVQYLIVCCLSIGIMLLIMFFPDKICDGFLQHISDIEFVKKNFGTEYLIKKSNGTYSGVLTEKVITRYHIDMGIMMTILLVHYIICGIAVADWYDGLYSGEYSFCLALPLVSLGTLIIFDLPMSFFLFSKIIRGIISAAYIAIIESYHYWFITHVDSGSGGDSGTEEYDVIIIKH